MENTKLESILAKELLGMYMLVLYIYLLQLGVDQEKQQEVAIKLVFIIKT